MTRISVFLLSLCLLCPLILMPVAAATAVTVTLHVGEDSYPLTEDVLPVPDAPAGKVFAGWAGEGVFLPAGVAYTGESDVDLTAIFVGISTTPDTVIRTQGGKNGIRFLAAINKADLAVLKGYTDVRYGMYLAPAEYVTEADGVLTPAALQEKGKSYLEITTDKLYAETEVVATVAGSLVDVLSKNYYRRFQAAGYVEVTYTNQTSGTVVSPASSAVRLYDLALAAFSDRTFNANATHPNAAPDGKYSPYGTDHLNYFARVMDSVVSLKYFAINETTGSMTLNYYGYQPPYVAEYDQQGHIVFTVKEGQSYRFNKDLLAVITKTPSNGQYKEATGYQVRELGTKLKLDYVMGDFSQHH